MHIYVCVCMYILCIREGKLDIQYCYGNVLVAQKNSDRIDQINNCDLHWKHRYCRLSKLNAKFTRPAIVNEEIQNKINREWIARCGIIPI